jgi:hypothetical protein
MSDLKTLRELADLASEAAQSQPEMSVAAGAGAVPGFRAQRPRVAELLGVVMAMSSRSRRMTRDTVQIDLDVFAPDGRRAVRFFNEV